MGIEQQINTALAGRAAQHGLVDELGKNWKILTDSFSGLISAAADLAGAAGAVGQKDPLHSALLQDLGRYLGDQSDWRVRATTMRGQLGAQDGALSTLYSRVHRDTVNIGVIGLTGAGKSTLLRKLSGLTEAHIPSNRTGSSTATPSKIFHEPSGPGRAELHLHTWDSFRDEFLAPLHHLGDIGQPAPRSVADFRQCNYHDRGVLTGRPEARKFLIRLRDAQRSLDSYEPLLRGGSMKITLDELRPYVAYPTAADPRQDYRPYHAVRSVDIFCTFPGRDAVKLGLVDLPGAGEAGLDVHGRFLKDLRNDTDLLFIVKRPEKAGLTDPDWAAAQLAFDASAGVSLRDFAREVLNRDDDIPAEHFAAALDHARKKDQELAIELLVSNLAGPAHEVIQTVLAPTLDHLADRLAVMDRDAILAVLKNLGAVARQARTLAAEVADQVRSWRKKLPDEEKRLRGRVEGLRNKIGGQLGELCMEYDERYDLRQPIAELDQEIGRAGQQIRQWLASGLGSGSADWMTRYQDALQAGHDGAMLDTEYNSARQRVVEAFERIDASLALAVERLWGDVAGTLRAELTATIIPEGNGQDALAEFAEKAQDKAPDLGAVTNRLLELKTDYGSIFLRVGRPVVRKLRKGWQADQATPAQAGVVGQVAGALAGAAVSAALGETPASGAAAAAKWWQDHAPVIAQATGRSAVRSSGQAGADPAIAAKYPKASEQYQLLATIVEEVTDELERGFREEALRTVLVLAAAIDLFKEGATRTPKIEVEYERLCARAQHEIWPGEFGEASMRVVECLSAMDQCALDTESAADSLAALTSRARQLRP